MDTRLLYMIGAVRLSARNGTAKSTISRNSTSRKIWNTGTAS